MISFDYKKKYKNYNENILTDIKYHRQLFPNSHILIELDNTIGLTSKNLTQFDNKVSFRIVGGYTDERIKKCSKYRPDNGNDYYYDCIYSRNMLISIMKEIERIESRVNPNWQPIQKLIYLYDRIKNGIMYDPKFESNPSKDIRSLRGLVTHETVCAGYSLIYKELLERQGIVCHYVESVKHAWNIVELDGKLYPVDLTLDNRRLRDGHFDTHDYLAQDIKKFSKTHKPLPEEPVQNYIQTLSAIDSEVIRVIGNRFNIEREYQSSTYRCTRENETRFMVSQIGDSIIDGVHYYRYFYASINDGKVENPLILYSEDNIINYVEDRKFNKPTPFGYEEAVIDILFSEENIYDSLQKNSYYIGKSEAESFVDVLDFVIKPSEIVKPAKKLKLFSSPARIYQRSDGTTFVCQQMSKSPVNVGGIPIRKYDIFEFIENEDTQAVKKNSIYTEQDLFADDRLLISDYLLSRYHLDESVLASGGYIGYLDENDKRIKNSKLIDIFSLNSRQSQYLLADDEMLLPPFYKLKQYALDYEIDLDSLLDESTHNIEVLNKDTKEKVNDPYVKSHALFANYWFTNVITKIHYIEEATPTIKWSFDQEMQKYYDKFCSECTAEASKKGYVDTISLYQKAIEENNKMLADIILKMFCVPYICDFLNVYFTAIAKKSALPASKSEPLYDEAYASSLISLLSKS